ncbi:hypothetical protein [Brevundimonas sp.]|jgi:hypothetical protein|uniref:hypothetical protein n=1 Tax=Brevundimonas sp. TaxID=1871086 RepID=UPI002E12EA6F|nr:hypothetical protein [Brevundimonas sp.]
MRRSWAVASGLLGLALLAGVAWTQTAPTPTPQAPAGPPVPATVALTPDRAEAAALAQARRNPLAVRLRDVLSKSPARAALPAIQASETPVLGPPDPALLATARFIPGDGQYTLVVRDGDTVIEIFGTTRALRSPTGAPLAAPLAPPPRQALTRGPSALEAASTQARQSGLSQVRTERTEYGVDVSFSRFGAAYNVTFICEGPGGSVGCTEADAVAFAASLIVLGGGQ